MKQVKNIRIEGDLFFNFLETNLAKDNSEIRSFNGIDIADGSWFRGFGNLY